jgi:N-acetylmuramoyl-L-alanine amidase
MLKRALNTVFLVVFLLSSMSVFSQTDTLKSVVAQKGDGIYKILRENGYSASEYYDVFVEINKENIGEDDSLIRGETYYLPVIETVGIETSDTSAVLFPNLMFADTIVDNQLHGAVFYLISGHGGPDPGAITEVEGQTVSEDEYAYDITLRLAVKLEEHGAKVFMIINDPNDSIRNDKYLKLDYDEYCYPDEDIPRNQNERLKQRADAVNDLYEVHEDSTYHRVIVIHVDSRTIGAKVDVFFYHFPGSDKGKATAENLQSVFAAKYAKYQPNRGYEGTVSGRNLLVIRKSLPPAVFIELGNIQNERDRKRFFNHNNRQALAKWIAEGLIEDYTSTID